MKEIAFGLIVTFLLLACSTSQKYDQQLKSWVGQSESSLISAWGRPSIVKETGQNSKIMTYVKIDEVFVPFEYYMYNNNWGTDNVIYDPFMDNEMTAYNAVPGAELEEICQTSFWINNGIITAWKWRGNNCVAD